MGVDSNGNLIIRPAIGSTATRRAGINGRIETMPGLEVPEAGTGRTAHGADVLQTNLTNKTDVLLKMGPGETLAILLTDGAFTVASHMISPHFTI